MRTRWSSARLISAANSVTGYENQYGYVFDFLNGRVQQVREYFNSLLAAEAFGGLLWPIPRSSDSIES